MLCEAPSPGRAHGEQSKKSKKRKMLGSSEQQHPGQTVLILFSNPLFELNVRMRYPVLTVGRARIGFGGFVLVF